MRPKMMSQGVLVLWLLWLALLGSLSAAAAAANTTAAQAATATQQIAQHNTTSKAVGFYIDEGYFLEGDTEILRAFIAGERLLWPACPLGLG
jgi:hypothetical protein